MLRSLYPWGKSPCCQLCNRLGEPQSRSGLGGEDKKSLSLPGKIAFNNQTLNKQSRKPIRGGTPAWGLDEELTTPNRKNPASYVMLHSASELAGTVNMIMNLRVA